MKWLIENWFLLAAIVAGAGVSVRAVYRFFGLPTKKQQDKIKEWLIWACIEAEKALQSGTGQLKLRQVYDMFCAVPAFTWVARVISFERFSDWLAESLVIAKQMLISNRELAEYVYGDKADEEVEKIKRQFKDAEE